MSKAIEVWDLDLMSCVKATRNNYRLYFRRFLERYGVEDGEDLYKMRLADLASGDTRDHRRVERMIKVYMAEMLEDGYAAGTCRMVSKALTSFFESQDLPLKLKSKDKPKGYMNGSRVALDDQIREMWDVAPQSTRVKTRAQLMFLKDSGIRMSDLAALDIGDYLESQVVKVDDEVFRVFHVRGTEKTKAPAYIHIGPEAVMALDRYLEERGEEDPERPLFVNRYRKRFRAQTICVVFQRLGSKVGKKISGHSLRKFHTTTLQGAQMNDAWIKKLQGKAVTGAMGPYSHPEETGELTPAYLKAYSRLRVFGEEVTAQKMEEQAQKMGEQAERIKELEARPQLSYEKMIELAREVAREELELAKREGVSPPPISPQ